MKLKSRFFLLIGLLYILGAGASFFAFFRISDPLIHSLTNRFARKEALYQKARILTMLDRELVLSKRMASDPIIRQWFQRESEPALKEMAFQQIEGFMKSFRDRETFLVVDKSLDYYAFVESKKERYQLYKMDMSIEPNAWYKRIMEADQSYQLNLDWDNYRNEIRIWINQSVYNDRGKKIGALGTGLVISSLLDEIVHHQENGIQVVIVDRDGIIQVCDDFDVISKNASTYDPAMKTSYRNFPATGSLQGDLDQTLQILSGENPPEVHSFEAKVDGKKKIVAVSYIPALDWFNIVIINSESILTGAAFIPLFGITILAILLIPGILALFFNRLVLSPLESLTDASTDIAAGKFTTISTKDRKDEIGILSDRFNTMARTIQSHILELEDRVKERTKELIVSNENLDRSNKKITESIRYASLIQASIFPDAKEFHNAFSESFVMNKPMEMVGGDFHILKKSDTAIYLGILDCTGHGVPGALMTMSVSQILDHILLTHTDPAPSEILAELNRRIKETVQLQGIDAGLDAGICRIDRQEKTVEFAGSGISLFICEGETIDEQKGNRQRIGYRNSRTDYRYTDYKFTTQTNPAFYMTSDGFLDEPGGEKGFAFGTARFVSLLQQTRSIPLPEQKGKFEKVLEDFRGPGEQRDDITVIGFRV